MQKILVCSGPPEDKARDAELAVLVDSYDGARIICGGTTSIIIARELARDITVKFKRDASQLPATSYMEGVDLMTEGIVTLTAVRELLSGLEPNEKVVQADTDGVIARMLLDSDRVDFIIGTRVKPCYKNGHLPVKFERREDLVKEIAGLLESKFGREVTLRYI